MSINPLDSQADETVPSNFEPGWLHMGCQGDVEKDSYWQQAYCHKCGCMVPSNQVTKMVELDDREQ